MANVNLRELPDELIRQVKIAAATESKTLKDWVVSAMELKLEVKGEGKSGNQRERVASGSGGTGIGDRPRKEGLGRVGKARDDNRHHRTGANRVAGGKSAAGFVRNPVDGAGAATAAVSSSNLESHDPKSCRIYKCGSCAALGYKDAHRGLS
jgi:plasmid stability protein